MGSSTNKTRARRGRSEGSIYQRKDGRWCGVVSLGIHKGKRARLIAYGETKGEAAEKLRELQSRADAGQLPDAKRMALETWLTRWLAIIKPTVEPNTYGPYKRHVDLHIVPRIGSVRVQRLRAVDIETLYARLLTDGVSAALTRKIGTTLSVALGHAVRSQLIPSNPTTGVKRPKALKPKIEVLDAAQAARLIVASKDMRFGPLFALMLDAGVGPGEALALTWADVDFEGNRISVTRSLEEIGGRFRIKAVKAAKRNRSIDIGADTIADLHRHRKAMLKEGRNVRRGPVFVSTSGGHVSISNLHRDHYRPALAAAGLPTVSLYALRHTMATLLLSATPPVHPKIVSERLGHASIVLTLDTYSHCLPGMQRGAADVIAKLLRG